MRQQTQGIARFKSLRLKQPTPQESEKKTWTVLVSRAPKLSQSNKAMDRRTLMEARAREYK